MLSQRAVLLAMMVASPALAQNLTVIPVPLNSSELTAPHAAYNGHATTFKAIARGGDGSYLVEWDFEGDGTFDTSRTTTNRYDLSERFTYPNVTSDTEHTAVVRVTSNGQATTASYRVRVFADVPVDPNLATPRQLEIMRSVVIDDSLWFLHNRMTRSGNEADPLLGARATGSLSGADQNLAEGDFLEALGRNGHFVAFPPAYVGVMRDAAGNARRYDTDPYAEDAFRLVNQTLNRLSPVAVATSPFNTQGSPNDESNATGFYPELVATPISGTDDGLGLFVSPQNTGYQAAALRGLASMRLGGYVAQVGDLNRVLGRTLPFVVQQMVDGLVWAQNDGGSYPGSYYYTPNANAEWLGEYSSGALLVAEALWWTEQMMASEGVIVPNIAKVRMVSYLLQIAENCPAGGRGATMVGSATGCDVSLSAIDTLMMGWMKGNQFLATDNLFAFPGYSLNANPTRGVLRSLFDGNQLFVGNVFLAITPSYVGWDYGFVEGGDFSRTDGRYDLWTMIHWARAARAVEPEVATFGAHDWERQFSRILINSQATDGGAFTWLQSSTLNNHNDNIVGPAVRAAWAIVTMSPDEQRPIAVVRASPASAPEGSSVSFTSSALVHDEPTWSWSLGNGDTRTGASFSYAFPDDGTFTVTGSATTAQGATSSHSTIVTVTNVPPVVDAGADVTVPEGASVAFTGSFTDPGTRDPHTASWQFGDGQSASSLSAAHVYVDDGVFTATLSVTDDDAAGTDTAQITVTNVAPTITSTPPSVAIAGRSLSYTLTFTDPGTTDVHSCSGTAPAGGTFSSCTLTWTPAAAQVGVVPLSLCVSDDDGAQTCQAFQVTITPGAPNQLPSAPVIASPNGTQVSGLQPTLSVTNAVDPENDPLTYDFEVFQGFARVVFATGVPEGMGTTEWQVSTMLTENERYTWRARAVSGTGAGAWSDTGTFVVNAANSAPPAPTLIAPAHGAIVDTLTPVLVFVPWGDPDGDAVTFEWQLAGDESFATVIDMGSGTATRVLPAAALSEDARYCWRVRADDGQAQSSWERACFRVSATDGAPSVPSLIAPADGALVTTTQPVFAWTASVDPEGEVVTYELEVAEGGAALASIDGLGGTATVLAQPLIDGHTYSWRVRAKAGGESAFTAASTFVVSLPDAGTPAAGGGGGGTGGGDGAMGGGGGGEQMMPSGCGCSGLPGGELALLALALVGRARRRRAA